MAQFRRKPLVIEAEQFLHDRPLPFHAPYVAFANGEFYVTTPPFGRARRLEDGDWVIPEPMGLLNGVVDARQFTGVNAEQIAAWAEIVSLGDEADLPVWIENGDLCVSTPNRGFVDVSPGEWVVCDRGEFFVLGPEAFAAHYEPVTA